MSASTSDPAGTATPGTLAAIVTATSRGAPQLRALVALSLACVAGMFAFAGAMGLSGSSLLSAPVAAGIAGLVAFGFWRRPIVALDEGACSRALKILSALATVAALFQLLRLTIFIVDPSQVGCAIGFSRGLGLSPAHSCLSAYFVAANLVDTTPNVYDDALYSLPRDKPVGPRNPRRIGTFNIDVYEYPPPFLLLPRATALLAPDFLRNRMLWFALDGAVILIGLLVVAASLGPVAGTRGLLLSPLVWAADATLSTLQIGNIQPMVIALAVIAMALVERRRYAAGGALLAYITVSKLFPGLLLVYLLARREWRALAWTTGLSVALVAISLLDTGWAPYDAFLRHLPGLLGGEAFPAFHNPLSIAKNYSVPGMAFKLGLFGVPAMSFGAAKIVGWIYTLIVLAAAVIVARRTLTREEKPLAWLAILTLATLRSPFLPGYAVFPPLWLLTLLAASAAPTAKTMGLVVLAWVALNVTVSQLSALDPRLISAIFLVPQAALVALAVLALRRQPVPAPAPSPVTLSRVTP
jgi:hypothetical protein